MGFRETGLERLLGEPEIFARSGWLQHLSSLPPSFVALSFLSSTSNTTYSWEQSYSCWQKRACKFPWDLDPLLLSKFLSYSPCSPSECFACHSSHLFPTLCSQHPGSPHLDTPPQPDPAHHADPAPNVPCSEPSSITPPGHPLNCVCSQYPLSRDPAPFFPLKS